MQCINYANYKNYNSATTMTNNKKRSYSTGTARRAMLYTSLFTV